MSNTQPPDGQPEYLEQGGGTPLQAEPRERTSLKKPLLVGGAVLGLAALGGGVWAAMSFLGTGAQPAEALPASTLAYAGIDLDPSGGQKVEAFEMLRKFPAFREKVGLDAQDDVKKWIFGRAGLAGECPGLDYEDDLEPWLGDRAAVAAVDTGKEMPAPVVVIEVTDADAAGDGLAALRECDGGGESGGWTIRGDWAVLAETQAIARDVADEAEGGTLADDATYRKWVGEAGDSGVVTMYAAPALGELLAGDLGQYMGPVRADERLRRRGDGRARRRDGKLGEESTRRSAPEPQIPDEVTRAFEDFGGAAAVLRFDDGALELEVAGDSAVVEQNSSATDRGDDALATLPADTAAAIGIGFDDGWAKTMIDRFAGMMSDGAPVESMVEEAERATGLSLPEDLETLAGDSTSIAMGSDFDPEAFFMSQDGAGVPVGLKVKGDPEAIEAVLEKIRAKLGGTGEGDAAAKHVRRRHGRDRPERGLPRPDRR